APEAAMVEPARLFQEEVVEAPVELKLDLLLPVPLRRGTAPLHIATINGDTWQGARTVLEWNSAAGRRFDVAFVQETRFSDSEAAGGARQWCLGQGCHLALGPPRRTGAERLAVSGGVGLCIGTHIGVFSGIAVPDEWSHRIVARKIHLGEGSVLLVISLYMITSIGLTGDNLALLAE
ncbi:unnamed protein product, partial [Prorocentrum cordatum]